MQQVDLSGGVQSLRILESTNIIPKSETMGRTDTKPGRGGRGKAKKKCQEPVNRFCIKPKFSKFPNSLIEPL